MNVILYTTDCPKCVVLKRKLDEAGIQYDENHDVGEMIALGMTAAPMLSVNGELMEFSDAIHWANEQ